MANLTTQFFGIEKADKNSDGTLTVYGKATDDSLDIDQQICDADWLKRAMPHWFKSGGNIREQHSNIAAGVAKEYEVKEDGHYITALVVDPVSVKKVENGVLKGFSIGIKNPRVTRDKSAMNGRIVDGQIVEVSLVDRPANPNCQLVLAKSVDGQDTVVQVEELHEVSENNSESNLQSEVTNLQEENVAKAQDIIELAKTFKPAELVKFDKATYDKARQALAELIAIEAKEMADEDHNEEVSIAHLLAAVHHLFAWFEGEEAEGEVVEEETYVEAAKSAEISKCLECGCNQPGTDHGLTVTNDFANVAKPSHVTTAEMYTPDQTPKSAEADAVEDKADEAAPADTEAPAEEDVKEDSADEKSVDVEAIVEEAIKSATQSIKSEIAELLSAKEAAESKANRLETELAEAKSLAVAGGPKRTAKPVSETSNDLLAKAAAYNAKAQATTDPTLAKGYTTLAKEFLAKATAESK